MKKQTKSVHSGPCSSLNVFSLTTYSLPVTVVMLNSFIHLSVSPHCFANMRLSGQFFQVFAHCAEVGELTRLYLLKTRCIGRMLE